MLVPLRQHLLFHYFGSEIRGRRLHVTRRVVAGDDVVSTGSVRCDSHADLGGGGPDNLSCEGGQYIIFMHEHETSDKGKTYCSGRTPRSCQSQ